MPFVPVPNTVKVETVFVWNAQTVENVYHFERATAPTEADITALLTTVRTIIVSDLMPFLSASIQFVRLLGTLLTAVDSLGLVLNVSPAVGGGSVGESLPNNSAFCISHNTAQRGRSFRGRTYFCGLSIDSVSGTNIDAAPRSGLLAFLETLRAGVTEGGWTMVVVSRVSGGVERVTGVTTPITGFTSFDTVLDSQRRRLPGRGT